MSFLLGLGLAAILLPMNYIFFLMMKKARPTQSIGIVMIMFGAGLFISGIYIFTILFALNIDKPIFVLGLGLSILINLFFKVIYTIKNS